MNNKTTLASATLVAAIPAAVLAFFLIGTFLSQLDHMPMMFVTLAAVTLLACAGVVFLPVGVMIFGPKGAAATATAPKAASAVAKSDSQAGSEAELESGEQASNEDESLEFGDESIPEIGTGEMAVVEGSMTRDDVGAVDVNLSDADIDAFIEEFATDDESKPAKKKK